MPLRYDEHSQDQHILRLLVGPTPLPVCFKLIKDIQTDVEKLSGTLHIPKITRGSLFRSTALTYLRHSAELTFTSTSAVQARECIERRLCQAERPVFNVQECHAGHGQKTVSPAAYSGSHGADNAACLYSLVGVRDSGRSACFKKHGTGLGRSPVFNIGEYRERTQIIPTASKPEVAQPSRQQRLAGRACLLLCQTSRQP